MKIPDHDDLEIALLDNNQDIVNTKFKSIPKDIKLLKNYERFIISLLNDNRFRPDPLFNIILSSLTALEENSLVFSSKDYYNTVAILVSTLNALHKLNPSLIFNQVIEKCDKRLRNGIISQYTTILSSQSRN